MFHTIGIGPRQPVAIYLTTVPNGSTQWPSGALHVRHDTSRRLRARTHVVPHSGQAQRASQR
jgi:hypothetical protein